MRTIVQPAMFAKIRCNPPTDVRGIQEDPPTDARGIQEGPHTDVHEIQEDPIQQPSQTKTRATKATPHPEKSLSFFIAALGEYPKCTYFCTLFFKKEMFFQNSSLAQMVRAADC
jgi:hypothetical protein